MIKIIHFLVIALLLVACNKNQSEEALMSQKPFIIQVGIDPATFTQRNGLDNKRSVDRQPAGLNFYEKDWNIYNRGRVELQHGQYGFTINHALSVMGTESIKRLQEGLYMFNIGAGLVSTGEIYHDQARLLFMAMLQDLLQKGWRGYIHYEAPRLQGHASFEYLGDDELYTPDPGYTPTLAQWMALRHQQSWSLYADGLFLNITVNRDTERLDPEKPGGYYLSFEIYGKNKHAYELFDQHDREQWQSLWVDEIKKLKLVRYKIEAALAAKGYTINTAYTEPLIHPADPVEPER